MITHFHYFLGSKKMRWAKSYSILDHQLLHGGYLHRLNHESMSLYLFLAVVGDREGKSYYSEATIIDILRLKPETLEKARNQLIEEGLIEYRQPNWWVKNISEKAMPTNNGKVERAFSGHNTCNRSNPETARKQLQEIFTVISNLK